MVRRLAKSFRSARGREGSSLEHLGGPTHNSDLASQGMDGETKKPSEAESIDNRNSDPLTSQRLRTWKLTRTDVPSSLWSLATFATVAYVRAPGPFEARLLAAEWFKKYDFYSETPSPCLDPDLVDCREVMDDRFNMFDAPCVLPE